MVGRAERGTNESEGGLSYGIESCVEPVVFDGLSISSIIIGREEGIL